VRLSTALKNPRKCRHFRGFLSAVDNLTIAIAKHFLSPRVNLPHNLHLWYNLGGSVYSRLQIRIDHDPDGAGSLAKGPSLPSQDS
ncbi:MAG: hypothetical protein ACKOB7_06485, partial [Methylocystis sp.]